jgi:hypothetical protein
MVKGAQDLLRPLRTAQRNQEPSCDLFQDEPTVCAGEISDPTRREDGHEVYAIAVMSHTPHPHEGPATANVGALEVSGLPQRECAAQLQIQAVVAKPGGQFFSLDVQSGSTC